MSGPLRVAVVGSGPAGFYAAGALLDAEVPFEVDMIERLPTPWGLVRLGVAPDHPKLKTVSRAFERIALKPGFRFFGNVEVGRDLTHQDLTQLYDAVIYAFGAQSDRRLGIPGEELPGSWSATELVAWYNGHPDFQELEFDLNVERAVVIGNGNVALDVARMLALTPEELAPTDTTDPAIEAIGSSTISDIVVVGRRGPAQASWTTQELKELGELAGADVVVDPAELDPRSGERGIARARHEFEAEHGGAARVRGARADRQAGDRSAPLPRIARRDSRRRPGRSRSSSYATGSRSRTAAWSQCRPTNTKRSTAASSFAASATAASGSPSFPSRSGEGRSGTSSAASWTHDGRHVAQSYCAGWIKRGPTGIIGTNKKDATETVAQLLEDVRSGRVAHREEATPDAVEALLAERDLRAVMYPGWTSIDELERAAGEKLGRPRVKLRTWDELLEAAERVAAEKA